MEIPVLNLIVKTACPAGGAVTGNKLMIVRWLFEGYKMLS
jgi:hypothetical protein